MTTLGGQVTRNAGRVPHREALVDGSRRWTWAELDVEVGRAAARLAALGLRRSDRLGVLAANTAEHVVTVYAALRLGAVVAPLGTRLAAPEVTHIVRDAGCRVLAHDPALTSTVTAATRRLSPDETPALLPLGPGDEVADYKLPRELVLGAVPRNGAGKLQKHVLRARLDLGAPNSPDPQPHSHGK